MLHNFSHYTDFVLLFCLRYCYTCVCVSEGKKCLFFVKFGVLCFLETPVLRFALLPYYRQFANRESDS